MSKVNPCKFIGMHWQVDSKKACGIAGFLAPKGRTKCFKLRSGWTIKNVRLSGNFVWSLRPVNTPSPWLKVWSENNSPTSKVITIQYVTLIGPEGPANKWQEAFNHCSDLNYRP